MAEPTTNEVTGIKKLIVAGLVGTVAIMCIVGIFVPEARVYIVETTKFLLSGIQAVAK